MGGKRTCNEQLNGTSVNMKYGSGGRKDNEMELGNEMKTKMKWETTTDEFYRSGFFPAVFRLSQRRCPQNKSGGNERINETNVNMK